MKQMRGVVVSNKMNKTVGVRVDIHRMHPKYKKRVKISKRYLVHTEKQLEEGKKVIIEETRPISKRKKWRVVKVLK